MLLDVATLANIAIALSVFVAVFFGVVQARGSAKERRERLTLQVVRGLQTREFAAHMHSIRLVPPPPTTEEWDALPMETRVTLLAFSQEMEMLGLLVFDATIDIDLVERTLGSFVVDAWARYKPGFESLRVSLSDPYLGEYFQWLAQRVDARMAEHPRRPAYESSRA